MSVVGRNCLDSCILFPRTSLVGESHPVVMICSEAPAVKAAEAGHTVTWVTRWAMAWREVIKSFYVSLEPQVRRKARKGIKKNEETVQGANQRPVL